MILKYSFGQEYNPCQKKEGTKNGDTLITFFPNCSDTATYVKRRYSKNGIIWSNESYKDNVINGISWFTSQNEGILSYYYENGKVVKLIYYYPNSGIPRSVYEYLSDTSVYINNFYPSGNPMSIGYSFIDSIGDEHKKGKWIEYDSLGYSYWIGNYIPVHIEKQDTVQREFKMLVVYTVMLAVRHGIWKRFDSMGKENETIIYKEGNIIKKE